MLTEKSDAIGWTLRLLPAEMAAVFKLYMLHVRALVVVEVGGVGSEDGC